MQPERPSRPSTEPEHPPQAPPPDRVLTVAEVADRLRVSEFTVREWLKARRLLAHRTHPSQGGRWRIPASEVDRFLAESLGERVG